MFKTALTMAMAGCLALGAVVLPGASAFAAPPPPPPGWGNPPPPQPRQMPRWHPAPMPPVPHVVRPNIRPDIRHVRWCERRYRSYDRRSNTYRGYDGRRHMCVSPYGYYR